MSQVLKADTGIPSNEELLNRNSNEVEDDDDDDNDGSDNEIEDDGEQKIEKQSINNKNKNDASTEKQKTIDRIINIYGTQKNFQVTSERIAKTKEHLDSFTINDLKTLELVLSNEEDNGIHSYVVGSTTYIINSILSRFLGAEHAKALSQQIWFVGAVDILIRALSLRLFTKIMILLVLTFVSTFFGFNSFASNLIQMKDKLVENEEKTKKDGEDENNRTKRKRDHDDDYEYDGPRSIIK